MFFFRSWTAPAENNTCNLMQDQPLGKKSQSSLLPLFREKKCWLPTSPKELLKRQNKPLVKGVCMLWRTYTVDGEALLMGPESATSTIEFLPVAWLIASQVCAARPPPTSYTDSIMGAPTQIMIKQRLSCLLLTSIGRSCNDGLPRLQQLLVVDDHWLLLVVDPQLVQ